MMRLCKEKELGLCRESGIVSESKTIYNNLKGSDKFVGKFQIRAVTNTQDSLGVLNEGE